MAQTGCVTKPRHWWKILLNNSNGRKKARIGKMLRMLSLISFRICLTIMEPKPIKLTNLIQGGKYYDLRHAIYWPKGCAPALTAAMGMGGGFVPLLVVIK